MYNIINQVNVVDATKGSSVFNIIDQVNVVDATKGSSV